jgi:hypothetical protein
MFCTSRVGPVVIVDYREKLEGGERTALVQRFAEFVPSLPKILVLCSFLILC